MTTNMPATRDHEFISIADVAAELHVTDRFVRRLIADGELRAVKLGSRLIRIRRSDLESAMRPITRRR